MRRKHVIASIHALSPAWRVRFWREPGYVGVEARAVVAWLCEPHLWIALAVGLTLWTLAYQLPYTYQLDVGGNRQTQERYYDAPFLTNFNAPEPASFAADPVTVPFRWAQADSTVTLPGLGGGSWNVTILAASGRERGAPVQSRWDDGTAIRHVSVAGAPRRYWLTLLASPGGDLTLHLATPPRLAPDDPRSLGLVVFRINVTSAGGRFPALPQLAYLGLALALVYILLRRLVLPPRPAFAACMLLAASATAVLALAPLALTLLAPFLPGILSGAYVLGVTLNACFQAELARVPPETERRVPAADPAMFPAADRWRVVVRRAPFVGLMVLAVVVRLGGMLHPQAIFSDVRMNVNSLVSVASGDVYFTRGLPAAAGGGQMPYLPGQYILMAPALTLVPLDGVTLETLVKVGNALWDSLVVGLLWYVLRRGGSGAVAALAGAALYVLPPPILKSLSIGELANVFGQGLALPVVGMLALRGHDSATRRSVVSAFVLLSLALLGHLGVTISLIGLLGSLGVIWLIRSASRRAALTLCLTGMLAVAFVALCYHTAFVDIYAARLGESQTVAAPPDAGFGTKLLGQLATLPSYGIHPLAVLLGLLGLAIVVSGARAARARGSRASLGVVLAGWWGGTFVSLGLLLFASQGVRWQAFLYPALCLGAGPVLGAIWKRGRVGRVVSITLLSILVWAGLTFWIAQVRDYLHS